MTQLRSVTLAATLMALQLLCVSSSFACSPGKIATPQELVEDADAIYHVRADKEIAGPPSKSDEPQLWLTSKVAFRVLSVLKGAPRSTLQFPASSVSKPDPNDRPVPYDFVRPGGRWGNCYANTFMKRQEYLLPIKGGTPYWSALAPTTEQVNGATDPWLTWVRVQLAKRAARSNNSFKPNPHRGGARVPTLR